MRNLTWKIEGGVEGGGGEMRRGKVGKRRGKIRGQGEEEGD